MFVARCAAGSFGRKVGGVGDDASCMTVQHAPAFSKIRPPSTPCGGLHYLPGPWLRHLQDMSLPKPSPLVPPSRWRSA